MMLSVVIIALNEAAALPALLDDLQALRAAGHELIVVDGGSNDGTQAIALRGADRVVQGEPGRARQLNSGARIARGDLFWFLHADSRVGETLPDQLTSLHEPCWGRFDVRIEAPDGGYCALGLAVIAWFMNRRSRLTGIMTGDQGLFVSRALFERVGGFPELPLMEDIAFSRALKRVAAPLCLPGRLSTSGRRWCERGLLRTLLLMWWLRLAYWLGVSPGRLAAWYR